jgi:hypothetical protein
VTYSTPSPVNRSLPASVHEAGRVLLHYTGGTGQVGGSLHPIGITTASRCHGSVNGPRDRK